MEQHWMHELYHRLRQEQMERELRDEQRANGYYEYQDKPFQRRRAVNFTGEVIKVHVREAPVEQCVDAYLKAIKHRTDTYEPR